METPTSKTCKACGLTKPLEDFEAHRHGKYGRVARCRPCHGEYRKAWRQNNRELILAQYRRADKRRSTNRSGSTQQPAPKSEEERNKAREQFRVRVLADPAKRKAQLRMYHAIRAGELERPDTCEWCEDEAKVQGHHHDYSKPLEVTWLCPSCHRFAHTKKIIHA